MTRAVFKWALFLVAMLLVGPVAGRLIGSVRAPDGGPDATALLSESPAWGITATLGAVALAGVITLIGARFLGPRSGFFAGGLVLLWGAWAGGRLDGIIRRTQSDSSLWPLAVEGLALGALGVLLGLIALRLVPRRPAGTPAAPLMQGALGAIAGFGVAAAVAWAVARSDMAGQTIAAATLAATLGTLVGQLVDHRATLLTFVAVGAVLAFAGPASAAALDGPNLVARVFAGTVFPLARPMPLDWLAGTFLGVPLGAAWAASMLEKRPTA